MLVIYVGREYNAYAVALLQPSPNLISHARSGSLLSRLMGPLMGASYGLAILDQELFLTGVRNVTIALLIIISLGGIIGVSFAPFAEALLWPTDEMATRGVYLEMMFGAIIAICGGASVAIAESNEDLSSVAGIAISSALVPPAVNSGICFTYLLVGDYFSESEVDTGLFFRIGEARREGRKDEAKRQQKHYTAFLHNQ